MHIFIYQLGSSFRIKTALKYLYKLFNLRYKFRCFESLFERFLFSQSIYLYSTYLHDQFDDNSITKKLLYMNNTKKTPIFTHHTFLFVYTLEVTEHTFNLCCIQFELFSSWAKP
jgi:hypothetical protein